MLAFEPTQDEPALDTNLRVIRWLKFAFDQAKDANAPTPYDAYAYAQDVLEDLRRDDDVPAALLTETLGGDLIALASAEHFVSMAEETSQHDSVLSNMVTAGVLSIAVVGREFASNVAWGFTDDGTFLNSGDGRGVTPPDGWVMLWGVSGLIEGIDNSMYEAFGFEAMDE